LVVVQTLSQGHAADQPWAASDIFSDLEFERVIIPTLVALNLLNDKTTKKYDF
jgi:hypothetical protein